MDWKNLKRTVIGAVTAGLAYVGFNLAQDDASNPKTSSTEVCVVDKTGKRAQIVDSKTFESRATMPRADLGRIDGESTGKLYTPKDGGLGWKDDGYGLKVGIDLCTQFERGNNATVVTNYNRAKGIDLDKLIDAKIARAKEPEYSAVHEALSGKEPRSFVIAPDTTEQPIARPVGPSR